MDLSLIPTPLRPQEVTMINWYKQGFNLGKVIGSTDEFQAQAMKLQSATGIILDGASPYRSQEGTPANNFWDGFHRGRNA
jgi:elongation factor P--beta-lysine ligase